VRRLTLAALIVSLCLPLCGCQETGEVENQAYVLVLALDRGDNGGLTLTARVPKIGKGGGKDDEGGSGSNPYLTFSVWAPSWSQALDALQWATPRRINLSHIEMIVASGALASLPSFAGLLNEVADTPHLYANARFVICSGDAGEFLEAGETVIGSRLSTEIRAMLSQYAQQGFIPDVCLADVCYAFCGIYGDPVAIWGETSDSGDEEAPASRVTASAMRQRFPGAALFVGGRFVRALSSRDTRLLNLIRGQTDVLPCEWRDGTVVLIAEGKPHPRATIDGDGLALSLSLRLRAPDGLADVNDLEASITGDISRLVRDCQRLGCDPFGFAESAAALFPTVPSWTTFDWPAHYSSARLDIDLTVSFS